MTKSRKSLFSTLVSNFLLYFCIVLLLMILANGLLDFVSDQSMQRFLKSTYQDVPKEIFEGNYSNFTPSKLGHEGFFEVYNDNGDLVYPEQSMTDFSRQQLILIPHESKRPIVTIEYYEDFKDQAFKEITFEYYQDLNKIGMDVLVINNDNEVNFTTFKNIPSDLTSFDINTLMGNLQHDYEISKTHYTNSEGYEMIVVYFRPFNVLNLISNSLEGMKGYLTVIFIGIFTLTSFIYLLVLNKTVKQPIKLLTEAIREVSFGNNEKLIEYKGPKEFENVCYDFNDMQERLKHEIAMKEMAESEKIKMLGHISHDLKTPITVINGFTKALIDHKIPEADKERIYHRILNKSDHLSDLIASFNEYTRLEHSDFKPSLLKVDFAQFLENFIQERNDEITLRGFSIKYALDNQPKVMIDPFLMTRVFDNLLSNVYKYTPENTVIEITLEQIGSDARIIFSDNGPGIKNDIKEHVFSPFTTGNEARSDSSGSGLGLSIIKRIMDLHGGNIELIDSPLKENGTIFKLTLSCQS